MVGALIIGDGMEVLDGTIGVGTIISVGAATQVGDGTIGDGTTTLVGVAILDGDGIQVLDGTQVLGGTIGTGTTGSIPQHTTIKYIHVTQEEEELIPLPQIILAEV